ncbi:hypothetical protein [Vibrio fluvialis]|uniref:hypothetical protein n=1 Tax=Vibrio fluvialis TaxID=676 RepID=UPI0023A976C4|nr:hypothetical protein [Vibrio fluvialis]MDE5179198.1 hypothetical protein [Vibrio fluvialis]
MSNLLDHRPESDTVYESESGQRLYVEDVIGDKDDDFYLVMIVPYEDKDDMNAAGDELTSREWVELKDSLGLKLEADEDTSETERLRSMFTNN